jgi:hypothetical protein
MESLDGSVHGVAQVSDSPVDVLSGFGEAGLHRLGERVGEPAALYETLSEAPRCCGQAVGAEHDQPDGEQGHYLLWAEVKHRRHLSRSFEALRRPKRSGAVGFG